MSSSDDELIKQIAQIVDKLIEENVAILGITIGTEIATSIYSKFKANSEIFNYQEIIASSTSFQYISKGFFSHVTKGEMDSSYITVEDYVVLMEMKKSVSAAMILDRKYAEMEGIHKFQTVLVNVLLKIAAFIETSDYIREDPLVKIMRAIPSATFLALISKEGLPIKVIANEDVQEPIIGSQVSAISNLTQVMLKKPLDYCLIDGHNASILVVQFDADRILSISLPETEKSNMGQHLARIKEIIHDDI